MKKRRVLYYVHTYFLDSCLETLQSIKHDVDIDLMIEVSPDSEKSTVFELSDINQYKRIEKLQDILDAETWLRFNPYFEHVSSVEVLFFKGKGMLSADSIKAGISLGRMIRSRHYDLVHFDTASGRALFSLFFLRHHALVLTIHDPVPHKGEESLLLDLVSTLYKKKATSILFYSHFSKKLFLDNHHHRKDNLFQLRLQPYSFITQFKKYPDSGGRFILFFGQLSYYKGIDLLLEAIPKVLDIYPQEQFVIAGKSNGLRLNKSLVDTYPNNISFIDDYLSIGQLSDLINASKFIVCPYREATQSGVLMTAFAMGKTVLATHVGAFPEYISNGRNGLLCDPESNLIADGIISMLGANLYQQMEKNALLFQSKAAKVENRNTLMHVYQTAGQDKQTIC